MNKTLVIEGKNCIETLLLSPKYKAIKTLYVDEKQRKHYQDLIDNAYEKQIPIRFITNKNENSTSKRSKSKHHNNKKPQAPISLHQGLAALCEIPQQRSLQDLKTKAKSYQHILILDHLQDAFNMGAIIRSAVALGIEALIYPNKRSCPITAGVIQASAGASHLIDHYQVANLAQSIKTLKNLGVWIYGTAIHQSKSLSECRFNKPLALVFGNEAKGLSSQLQNLCDECVTIEQNTKIDSLNVSAAAAIMIYSATHQTTYSSS